MAHRFDEGAIACADCGAWLPAEQNADGVYEIDNAGQLMWFAEQVNSGAIAKNANAILTDDIDMTGIAWTPICSTGLYYNTTTYTDKGYEGTFDGGGHTISNLKITGTDGVKASYGLFGTLSGTVKNLGMRGMTFSYSGSYDTNATDARAGAIAGQMLDGSLISDCFVVDSSLTPNNYIVGGIAGCNYAGTIQNCYTKNVTISAHDRCGNLVSDTRGDISTTDRPGTVKNCYTDASRVVGTNTSGSEYITGCVANILDSIFASGEITYKLNADRTETVWYQKDGMPAFSGSIVYENTCDGDIVYSTTDGDFDSHNIGSDYRCTNCGSYEPATLVTAENYSSLGLDESYVGYYAIKNASNLYWYSERERIGDIGGSIVLLNDITLDNSKGEWIPIGWDGDCIFDGLGNTITLKLDYGTEQDTASYGLFGTCNYSVVKNLVLDGNITVNTTGNVGAVAASMYRTTISGVISYVDVTNSCTSGGNVGGLAGYFGGKHDTTNNQYSKIENCAVYANVTGYNAGGLVGQGWNGTQYWDITNAAYVGNVTGTNAGAIIGYQATDTGTSTFTNIYWCEEDGLGFYGAHDTENQVYNNTSAKTADQFASGEVAYLLGESWGQTIGTEGTPVLGGDPVYQVLGCDGVTTTYSNTNENIGHSPDKDDGNCTTAVNCTVCGNVAIEAKAEHDLSCDNNGENHTVTCSQCDYEITQAHSYDETTLMCACGAAHADVEVIVTIDGTTTGYRVFEDAIKSTMVTGSTTAATTVKLLREVRTAVRSHVVFDSGTFTLDLNGCALIAVNMAFAVTGADMTIVDSVGTGSITGNIGGVGILYIDGGTVTITGGTIINTHEHGFAADIRNGTLTITGGSFEGKSNDITCYGGTVTLGVNETIGTGATFPGGISVNYGTTLNAILGEGAAYWQGDKQIYPADDATEISGGDVTVKAYVAPSGWTEIADSWYYYDPDTNTPVTGIVRVPYPAEAINGVTYAPNAEDIAYYENKGQTFMDKDTALFVFDENGVFQSSQNGLTADNRWAVNGHIAWHVGLVQIGEDYYYFLGDTANGGNKMATGDIYASRNTTGFDMVVGGVYTFGADGKLCKYDGITEVNGVLRYYENAQLMLGKGLIYVETTGGTCSVTLKSHNDNELNIIKVVREHLGLGLSDAKDLVESVPVLLSSTLTKDQADALVTALKNAGGTATMLAPGYYYVTSDGSLVVNANYWVANTNGYNVVVGAYDFDENGLLIEPLPADKDGVYYENGAWYYYENGKIGYNKGLINVNTTWHGADGSENVYSGYIYVRSSGKLATGEYYITTVNEDYSMFRAGQRVKFDENGMAFAPQHGIVDVDGILYFYQYGQIQYNAGLIEWNGGWIYVRSSGKVATGAYWITNTNGNLEAGMYEFGEDGYMVITDTEDGIVDENGVLYYYEDGKKLYGTGLRQLEDGTYIYVRTNGQLATGSYWITNHNGLLPEGIYTFGEDGILTVN